MKLETNKLCNVLRRIILHIKWRLDQIGFFNSWEDETYLKFVYKLRLGKKLNLDNPTSFNEKMQWLKLHDRNPAYTKMVDKYTVKAYVAKLIGTEHIIRIETQSRDYVSIFMMKTGSQCRLRGLIPETI